jgi:hypothetical protein
MPIGAQSKSRKPVRPGSSENNTSTTAAYVADRPTPKNIPIVVVPNSASSQEEEPPAYAESEVPEEIPKEWLPPTLESDLELLSCISHSQPTSHHTVLIQACAQFLSDNTDAFVPCRRADHFGFEPENAVLCTTGLPKFKECR